MESKPIVYMLVIVLAGICAFFVLFNMMLLGEYFIGISTLILGGATYHLASTEISEGKKRRRIERLRERLDGLYSPLMGLGKDFEMIQHHWDNTILNPFRTTRDVMIQVRFVYNYLASDALRMALDNYYSHETAPLEITETELHSLRVQFTADYEEIVKEYRQLTRSETEEKRASDIAKSMSKPVLPK